MNKKLKLTLATALIAGSAVYAFDTWIGNQSIYQVDTGLGNTTNTYGYWFSYADDSDGGKSEVQWPAPLGNDYSKTALDQVIEHCAGVCGTAVLNKGDLSYDPFVGIGFNVVGEDEDTGKPAPGNASSWGGICITYTSDVAPDLELGLGDFDSKIGYANPSVTLPKAASKAVSKAIAWSGFAQPAWYKEDVTITGPEASEQLVAVKFKIQNKNGEYKFNICAIGPYDGSCPTECPSPDNAIKSVRSVSSVKASLTGRVLSFSGVKSNATAEVMNLQGQVVAKGDASSAMNLAALDAGVYMVRVSGKSVNFSNKIVLK